MKKSLFFVAAASALMLTACSSENDVVQNTTPTQTTVQQQAVGFDVYTQQSTNARRAGLEGTMTTSRMQRAEQDGGGFGVYAFLTEDAKSAAGDGTNATSYTPTPGQAPNFMVNEKILWNSTNLGWYYNPLKYWPNETDKDSQTTPAAMTGGTDGTHLDRLTFFAYAPYVADGAGTTGITKITDKNGQMGGGNVSNPTITWVASQTPDTDFNPNQGVDLLWGVAPSGGLSYTAVNGWTVTRNEGTPLIDMIKPDVNTSMKFLFQHALARFGLNVVAAVDQIAPGGKLDPNTKITIESVKITGPFGTNGKLDLNNGTKASVANWKQIGGTDISSGVTSVSATNGTILVGANTTNKAIAANLRWKKDGTNPHTTPVAQTVIGVTTAKQDLLAPSTKWFNKLGSKPAYNPGKQYYSDEAGKTPVTAATYKTVATDKYYTIAAGVYSHVAADQTITAPAYPNAYPATNYFTLREIAAYSSGDYTGAPVAGANYYTKDGSGIYTKASPVWGSGSTKYYLVEGQKVLASEIPFAYADGTFYEAERNYLYVVPTNAALDINFGGVVPANEATLRTITVQIEYYISTEDSKLTNERAETKNVITKEVVLPSLANGKSYMLNLILGLTSVKIEAEVDDWKVVNTNADLPQNTSN